MIGTRLRYHLKVVLEMQRFSLESLMSQWKALLHLLASIEIVSVLVFSHLIHRHIILVQAYKTQILPLFAHLISCMPSLVDYM